MMLAVTASLWLAVRTDGMPGALDASSPADDPVEAAEVPTLPVQHVLPKAVPVALSLMKPASPFAQATQSLCVTPSSHLNPHCSQLRFIWGEPEFRRAVPPRTVVR